MLSTRRSLLQATTVGLVASSPLGAGLRGAVSTRPDTACIVLFLDGGSSHHETFDPKPDAPAEVRGEFGVIDTSVPGIRFAERIPHLARQAQHLAVLRSVHHGNPSHAPAEHQMLTGHMGSRPGTARAVIETPSLGSIVSRLRGPRREQMPAYVGVPWSFHHSYGGSPFGQSAYIGPRHEPFESGHPPTATTAPHKVPALELRTGLSTPRLTRRRELLGGVDRRDDAAFTRARVFTEEALQMLINPRVRQAFDLTDEPASLRQAYGSHEWGQGALLARRLIEAGTTFVLMQCGLKQDWDTHDNNFRRLRDTLLPPLDRAAAALIEDLAERGRLDETLIIVMGEFGRTPAINKQAGRDHWADVFSVLLAGGGLTSGQVVGASDRIGAYPSERPLHPHDLFATMYHVLGIDWQTLFLDRQDRPIPVLSGGTPIAELL